ncbi:phospholipase A2 inhibitor and Ly6/PLAUR domain-containing protein-like isoform X2 [Zootoca vivipara]|uniref:phospholipase A2 inhibitor and Ly6/PLAUR domain-containing protein-like isoform X2 n=1 Tax=Zootoca vivipara TaxID=8524 RepID=UPI00293BD42C|nr:phospholipase A2 inhibitor and Ly6/PLAUR domain-containing protein-like isoform X2 [Zootoca vivipara]
MKLFLLHLSAALVATANSLNCVCTGSPECSTGTCSIPESEAICVTVAQQNNMEGILATGISRGCQQDSQLCNEAVSVTVSGGLFTRTISRCCTTENCNKTPLELPPRNLTKNGVNCPASFALGSNRLEETGTLSCTGDEKSCISAAGELTAEHILLQGPRKRAFSVVVPAPWNALPSDVKQINNYLTKIVLEAV